MPGQEENLRMAAEVVDKFSGPLREMQKNLRSFRQMANGAHKEGAKAAREQSKAYHDLRQNVDRLTEGFKSGLEPALEGLGIGALGATAAIAAIGLSVRHFAGSARELTYLSQQTGLSVQALREFDAVARRIGSTPEAMNAGFETFANLMEQFRQNTGPLQEWFATQRRGANVLGWELKHTANNAAALKEVESALARISNPQQREMLLQHLGLDPRLARLSGDQLRRMLEDVRKNIGVFTPQDIARGIQAANAFSRISESVEKLEDQLAIGLSPAITQIAEQLGNWAARQDWRRIGAEIGATIKEVNDAAQAFGGWKRILEVIIAMRVTSWAFGVAKGIIEVTKAIRALMALTPPAWVLALLRLGGPVAAIIAGASADSTPTPDPTKKQVDVAKRQADQYAKQHGGYWHPFDDLRRWWSGHAPGWLGGSGGSPDNGLFHKSAFQTDRAPGGFEYASYAPGSAIGMTRTEIIIESAVFRGSAEGTKKGLLAAIDELENRPRPGGLPTAYEQSATAQPRGFGGGGFGRKPGPRDGHGVLPDIGAGRGDGRGPRALGAAMRYAQDQLIKEGLSPAHARAAAAALLGNAIGESSLNPNAVHDHGTGYGIYGAHLGRATRMVGWARAHGFARNSLEGQVRAMAHYAMTDPNFAATRRALEQATDRNLGAATKEVRRNFERPQRGYERDGVRIHGAAEAYAAGGALKDHAQALREHMKATARPRFQGDLLGHGRRSGVVPGARAADGKVQMTITMQGAPRGTSVKTTASDLFRSIRLNRGHAMPLAMQEA